MEILPKTLGTRPRLAVEIRWGGVIAARAQDAATGVLSAVARVELAADAVEPGLKAGNFRGRPAVVAAVKKALDDVTEKGLGREVTLVIPDATVRVLLLEFDTLPAKAAEALPLVRFRLKKLLPFDADDAAISYQVMSGARNVAKGALRVVAVAIPREVLEEYEAVVRDAGFEPGAVLPSTLAAIAGLGDEDTATLVVNAGTQAVTTAIVQAGVLLLHRSVDMSGNVQVGILAEATIVLPEEGQRTVEVPLLPLINVDASQQEWAMQEPVNPFSRAAESTIVSSSASDFYAEADGRQLAAAMKAEVVADIAAAQASRGRSAMNGSAGTEFADSRSTRRASGDFGGRGRELPVQSREIPGYVREITQAVSVAAAYFEDILEASPEVLLSAGSTSAQSLSAMLVEAGFGEIVQGGTRPRVREMVDSELVTVQAVSSAVPKGWLAGVRGALTS